MTVGGSFKMPLANSWPNSSRGRSLGPEGVAAPGMRGNWRSHSAMATSVPSARRGTRLSGGKVPWLAQASMASSMARNTMEVRTTLEGCWHTPRFGAFANGSAKCCELAQR